MAISQEVLLETRGLIKNFGGLVAVNHLDLSVFRGEIFGLVGPNGAGKSTILNMIGGTYPPSRGMIIYNNQNITNSAPHIRCRKGIGRVFQRNILFNSFNVLDNILAGLHLQSRMQFADLFFQNSASRSGRNTLIDQAMQILDYIGLAKHSKEPVKNLPYGYHRLLSLGVALATQPQLLLLDEPITGMNAEEIASMVTIINQLRDEKGITIILVEHNMKAVVNLCDKVSVLNFGEKIAEGPPKEVMANPNVVEAYLGVRDDAS
jgi:branched-chain amino acid transport system ATP-binding protein